MTGRQTVLVWSKGFSGTIGSLPKSMPRPLFSAAGIWRPFNGQPIATLSSSGASLIHSEVISLRAYDACLAALVVPVLFGGATTVLSYTVEASNDGVNWVAQAVTDATNAASMTPRLASGSLLGAYVRVTAGLEVVSGSGIGSAVFNLAIRLRKA